MQPKIDGPQPIKRRSHRRGGVFRRLWRWWRELWFTKLFQRFGEILWEWWYPPKEKSDGSLDFSRSARQNRLKWLWRRLRRQTRRSWIGTAFRSLQGRCRAAWYNWWYPASGSVGSGTSTGSRRRSRFERAWLRTQRRLETSRLTGGYRALRTNFYEWWYPREQDSDGHLSHRLLSRPVRFAHRCNRWFRQTWLGRKTGWLLDEVDTVLFQIRLWFSRVFAWRRIRSWVWSWKMGVAVACLLAAAVSWYRYGQPRFQQYREQRYATQAQQFFDKGDFARAMLRVRQVLSGNPTNLTAMGIIAELADRAGSPHALYWRQRMVVLNPNSTNRLALAKTSLRAEAFPFPAATKSLSEIEPLSRQSSTYHLVAGALAIRQSNLKLAEEHYAEALKLNPEDPVNRMSLAVVRLQSGNLGLITDSRTTLELLRTDQQVGVLATRSLIAESIARKELARAESLSWQILTNAQVSFSDRIVHLAILNAEQSPQFEAFLNETKKHAEEHAFYVGELAAWMNRFGLAQANLEWISGLSERITRQGMVPIAVADSYFALEQWRELVAYLKRDRWTGLEHVRLGMLTFASWKVEGGKRNPLLWQQAILVAAGSPAMLNTLAEMSAAWGWKEEPERVLWHAVNKHPNQNWPLLALERLYSSQRDTAGLRRVFLALTQNNPNDLLARNNYAMMSMLVGADVAKAQEYAKELHSTEPDNPVFASTYAFSLYLKGETQAALQILRAVGLERLNDPAFATYYGVFLTAAGDAKTAQDYLSKAAKAFLLPEEMALVEQARKSL